MPPTLAAARTMASGFASAIQPRSPPVGQVNRGAVDGHDLAALARAAAPRPTDHAAVAGDPDPLSFELKGRLCGHRGFSVRGHPLKSSRTISAQSASRFGLVLPAEFLARLRRVADEDVDLGRAEIARVDLDKDAAGACVLPFLATPFSVPCDLPV